MTAASHRIALVTFDADDTLWDFASMQRRGMEAAAALLRGWLGPQADYITGEYLTEVYWERVRAGVDPTQIRWLELRRQVFEAVLIAAGSPDPVAHSHAMAALYYRERNTDIPLLPGARETLDALRGRVALGWVTNGNETPDLVAGLETYFDVIVTPDRLGAAKPDPAVFERVAGMVGCETAAMMHVGDNPAADVAGARAAGCRAVWYNPAGRPNPTEHVPDVEIRHLTEVLGLLD